MSENYSYSRLETFKQCPYKYKLIYLDGHYIKSGTIATKFGSLIHKIEEEIGNCLKEHKEIRYQELISFFDNEILKLKEEFPKDFYELDKSGRTYEEKALYYRNEAIYRLERRVKENGLEIIACEKEFYLNYKDIIFHGFIDRILKDKDTYIIEDIKTYNVKLDKSHLHNPLQFIVYSLAFSSISNNIRCQYDLPLCNIAQECKIDTLDLDDILIKINLSDYKPNASPLCHWCVFSATYPNQPKEARGLCPYYSLWTKENKTKEVNTKWQDPNKDKIIAEHFKKCIDLKQ